MPVLWEYSFNKIFSNKMLFVGKNNPHIMKAIFSYNPLFCFILNLN